MDEALSNRGERYEGSLQLVDYEDDGFQPLKLKAKRKRQRSNVTSKGKYITRYKSGNVT